MDVGDSEEAVAAPGILCEAISDVLGVSGANDQQDFGSSIELAAEQNETLVYEGVHKSSMGLPVVLFFEGAGIVPSRAASASNREEL
jgi:hypothetical protein